jgi:transposase
MVMELEPWPEASQGEGRVINVEDWAEIRRLNKAEGMGVKAISRRLGIARNTVRTALRSDQPPRYEREGPGSIVDAVEPDVRELLKEFPEIPTTVIAERIGWERSITVLRDRVAELRPLFVPPDPCQRTSYRPGKLAQFDLWQPDVDIPVGFGQHDRLWAVVGVTGFARYLGAHLVPSRQGHDVLSGHLEVIHQFGAVPRRVRHRTVAGRPGPRPARPRRLPSPVSVLSAPPTQDVAHAPIRWSARDPGRRCRGRCCPQEGRGGRRASSARRGVGAQESRHAGRDTGAATQPATAPVGQQNDVSSTVRRYCWLLESV